MGEPVTAERQESEAGGAAGLESEGEESSAATEILPSLEAYI